MTDKAQKIRAEIERLLNEPVPSHDPQCKWEDGYWCALYKIEEFIDSLQEESNTKEYLCIKDFYPYKKGKVYKSICGGFPANAKEYFTLVKKSVSEDAPFEPIGISADAVELANIPNKKEPTIPDIVDEHWWEMLGEEPMSEDLGKCTSKIILEGTNFNKSWYAHPELAFKAGAEWQKKQDQETIELAEDHAMLAGMGKMKEQMMAKAVETTFNVSLPSGLYDKLWIKGCKEGDKLLVIKKDEL